MKALTLTKGPEGVLKRKDLIFIGLGQVVGSGVVTLIGAAQLMTGASAWIAYTVAVVIGLSLVFPIFIVGSTLRVGGGNYSSIYATLGQQMAGIYLLGQIPGAVGVAVYPIAISMYVGSFCPDVNSTLVAVATLTIFFAINLFGVKLFSKVQNVMGYILLTCIVMFIVLGIPHIDWSLLSFKNPKFFTNGIRGFWAAVFLYCYSTQGYSFVLAFGRDADHARKDIPVAMAVCVPIILILYTGCAMVATGTLPLSEVAGKPLTLVASVVLPKILFWLFIAGGVIMALTTSLNSTFGATSRIIGTGVADGWLPPKFAKTNKMGTRHWILFFIYLAGLIPILSGFDVAKITNNILLFTSFLHVIMYIGIFKIPRMYPEQWESSNMHMPSGLFYTLMSISIIMQLFVFYYSCRGVGLITVIISLSALVISFLYSILRWKSGKVHAQPSVWGD